MWERRSREMRDVRDSRIRNPRPGCFAAPTAARSSSATACRPPPSVRSLRLILPGALRGQLEYCRTTMARTSTSTSMHPDGDVDCSLNVSANLCGARAADILLAFPGCLGPLRLDSTRQPSRPPPWRRCHCRTSTYQMHVVVWGRLCHLGTDAHRHVRRYYNASLSPLQY
ncbi:hypothetical protein OH76DRAFT_33708 [Lentinus brumalis]|uniref:Uncharacterized protein n=1 Tax=Lentinus brumalis TaxID=2498619 RepID=A0A371DXY1_9APHY|nr:hypothetical protein OH76DRAFT_33708 [Polyporus brumalis]